MYTANNKSTLIYSKTDAFQNRLDTYIVVSRNLRAFLWNESNSIYGIVLEIEITIKSALND
jgi:hypothetical protein